MKDEQKSVIDSRPNFIACLSFDYEFTAISTLIRFPFTAVIISTHVL